MRRWRNAALLYGLALLIWLSLEDNSTPPVAAFGTGLALLWAWRTAPRFTGIAPRLLLGALTGAGAAVATTALMFFKTALHAHVYPDYPPGMLLSMLERVPIWAAAGALLAAAGLLLMQARQRSP